MSHRPSLLQSILRSIHYNCAPSTGGILGRVDAGNRHSGFQVPCKQDNIMPSIDQKLFKGIQVRSLATKSTKNTKNSSKNFYAKGTYLDREDVTQRVLALVRALPKIDPSQVTPKARFTQDLKLDSLETIELLMTFEEEFGLQIPNRLADKFTCSADAIDYITCHPRSTASTPPPNV